MTGTAGRDFDVRPLTPADLDAVVAIDRQSAGRARRGFFEKRLRAALDHPGSFVALAADDGEGLAGFAIARLVEGEFGVDAPAAELDVMGVDERRRGSGCGQALMRRLEEILARKGVREIHTQAEWTSHELLHFFSAAGFAMAARHVLERDAGELPAE